MQEQRRSLGQHGRSQRRTLWRPPRRTLAEYQVGVNPVAGVLQKARSCHGTHVWLD